MITFYLKDPKLPESPIWIQGYCMDGRIRKSTGHTIQTKHWHNNWINAKNTTPDIKRKLATIESHLKHIRSTIDNVVLDRRVTNKPVTKNDITLALTGKVTAEKASFIALYDRLITMALRGTLTKKDGTRYSESSMAPWRLTRNLLHAYLGDKPVDDITINDVRDFVVQMNQNNMSKNYMGLHIKNWKNAMAILHKLSLSSNSIYVNPQFRPNYEPVTKMYLTPEEINRIYDLELTGNLDRARDWFLIMYYTGLRVSDALSLSMQDIDDKVITMMNEKTNKIVVIPLHPRLVAILSKYNNNLPPFYSDVHINADLKIIGQMAGLTEKYSYKETRGGVSEMQIREKWEVLTCHSARRSITSNMIRQGISYELAGDMLGMSHQTFSYYNKLTKKDKAVELSNHPFFSE